MSWIISQKSFTRKDNEFLEECKDDAVNKSIPIIDETDPKYFPYSENNLPIPIVVLEVEKKEVYKRRKSAKEIGVAEYIISAMSKEHQQISTTTKEEKQVIVITPQKNNRKKKKVVNN